MIDTDERIQDLLDAEDDFGNPTFTWNGNDYICIPSASRTTLTPQPGSFDADKLVTMTVRLEQFDDDIPESQQTITFKDEQWMILQVDKDPFDVAIRLTCIATGKGAHG